MTPKLPILPSERFLRGIRPIALLAAATVLGAVLVHAWVQFVGVGPLARPVGPALEPLSAAPAPPIDPASLHLFGMASAPVNATPVAPPPNLQLIGVIAATGTRSAVALLQVDGRPFAFRPGDSIAPGVTLLSVARDRVVLDQGGQRSEVELLGGRRPPGAVTFTPLAVPGGAPGAPAQAAYNPAAVRAGMSPPPTAPFRLDVQNIGPNHLAFSKVELNRGLQDPLAAAALGRATPAAGGGLTLEDVPNGSLPERLGLRGGDVLRQANGQALNNLTDLPRLYQEFGNAQSVRLEIVRGGQPTTLQYTVRP